MNKKLFLSFLLFFTLLFLLSLNLAEGKGHGVEVRPTSSELVETEPGKIITRTFLVSNKTEQQEEFLEELKLPTGWRTVVSFEPSFILKAQQEKVRVVAFLVPITSPAGRYQITYSVKSKRDYGITDSETFSVEVLPVLKLDILVEYRPEIVVAGETYNVRLRVVNRSNTRVEIKLEIKGSPDYPVEVEPSEIILEAGRSQVLELKVKTDEKLKERIKHFLNIEAKAEGLEDGAVSVRQTVSVEVIPRITGEFAPYHRLPTRIRLIGIGENKKDIVGDTRHRDGFQFEFSGSGSLNEERQRKVDFLWRHPDIQEKGAYGKRNEYWFSYFGKLLDFHIGDRSYSLSPLIEGGYYGRGKEVDLHHSGFSLGSFFVESRWAKLKEEERGGYFKYQFLDEFALKGNFLKRDKASNSVSTSGYHDKIYSIQAEIKPVKMIDLDLEYAFSKREAEGISDDYAYKIDLDGWLPGQIRYSFQRTYARAEYFGDYNDIDTNSVSINFPIYHKLRGNFSYLASKNNLKLDPSKSTANREKFYKGGLSYSFPFGTSISLVYKDFIKQDHLPPVDYNYEEKAWGLRLGQTFGKLSLRAYMERGELEDKLLNVRDDPLERYKVYVDFTPSTRQSYSLYVEIEDSSFTDSPEKTKTAGISATWDILNNLHLNFNYRKENFDSGRRNTRDYISSNLTYTLPNKHSLSWRSHWFEYEESEREESSFLAVYIIPWEMAVSRKRSIGFLKGRIYDEEKPEKPPIPKVVLSANGATAVTNQKGEFSFPSLKPGTYYLRVERASIGLNRVTSKKLPIKVEIKGGETTEIELGVITSCRIFGKIAVFAFGSNEESNDGPNTSGEEQLLVVPGEEKALREFDKERLKEARGLGNILVEITSQKETIREFTDEKGRFSFADIRPGKWTLKVYDYDLPAYHYLEKDKFQIELKPREEKEITVRVLPRHRTIQFIDKGEVKEVKTRKEYREEIRFIVQLVILGFLLICLIIVVADRILSLRK